MSLPKITQRDFPLKAAYEFAAANGLGMQAEAIRKKSLRWKSRTSAVRSGYMIVLFHPRVSLKNSKESIGRTMRQKEAKQSIACIIDWF